MNGVIRTLNKAEKKLKDQSEKTIYNEQTTRRKYGQYGKRYREYSENVLTCVVAPIKMV